MATPPIEVIYGGLAVATYGAVLSTWTAVRNARRTRPGLDVVVSGITATDPGGGNERKCVQLVAHNDRDRVVDVVNVGLTTSTNDWLEEIVDALNDGDVKFPVRLQPGESKRFFFDWPIEETLHGWAQDARGRLYRGTPGTRRRRLTLWLVGPQAAWRSAPVLNRLDRLPAPQYVSTEREPV